ncbi:MAG: cysteine--tRNA ligase, partial [bacterium]|nr:cysteine--tRNA ligase [bacterium]
MKVYNTLSNSVEQFKEIKKGKIGMYMCGPTVYDYAHVGNFRSNLAQDIVKRYLLYLGYDVYHVMNLTDIDDKTIRKSKELNVTLNEVNDKYIEAFMKDLETLNITKADVYPRATEHIDEMLDMVGTLENKGYAYQKDNSVYFNIGEFKGYGKLANISSENLRIGVSVASDEYDKDNVQDFVLWKGKKEGEPSWESKYGDGRPGWHLECSAMSMKYIGETFDIHMGGVDLIFPHHENEIAQSECTTGKKFVNYWLHIQHLIVDNQKMSKSLGNFYRLQDLVEKGYDAMEIRYLLISTHYRKLLNFTFEGLERAKISLKRIKDFIFTLEGLNPVDGETPEITTLIETCENNFRENMNNDFNISGGLGAFFDFIHQANLKQKEMKKLDVRNVLAFVDRINSVLGVLKEEKTEDLDSRIEEQIKLRQQARKEKNYKLSDEIRDQLKAEGILLI